MNELEALYELINEQGLGPYSVVPPSNGADRWDVEFANGMEAHGIARDGRSSFEVLRDEIKRVASVRRVVRARLGITRIL